MDSNEQEEIEKKQIHKKSAENQKGFTYSTSLTLDKLINYQTQVCQTDNMPIKVGGR